MPTCIVMLHLPYMWTDRKVLKIVALFYTQKFYFKNFKIHIMLDPKNGNWFGFRLWAGPYSSTILDCGRLLQ
jgi:hypothetical protein